MGKAEPENLTSGDPTLARASRGLSDSTPARIWNLPNQLTITRIVLSIVFFLLLAIETHRSRMSPPSALALNVSLSLFILAVLTDFLDGYLARRWGLTSTFGRIADPFADKIVVCGGFVMLTGVAPRLVEPWFAVVIIFREFLVSGLRSFLESRGVAFGAAWSGKLKMVVQSVTIPLVLFYQANLSAAAAEPSGFVLWFRWLAVGSLALTLVLTVSSCVGYVRRAIAILRS
jgi:CDP-diacylglycerol--glycerol-3-phosphate 3-phosphatidyltransferase